ncbi:unnamed protein product [Nyctereutes procyonoides]|uniref:(raccoon dog) hypothetical protein n=1 Tax=Nyctereutes procyonoides TaxID=34880 RepID=A0A811YBG6_NYCPR|nr:unnamed protein product [Nyctereutes procyonoides]
MLPAAWRALGFGPRVRPPSRGLTCPEPRRCSPESPPAPGRGCWGVPDPPSRWSAQNVFQPSLSESPPRTLCLCNSPEKKKKRKRKKKKHRTCQAHPPPAAENPRSTDPALNVCRKVPQGSAPPHRPCYTCFKEEETEVLGCWVTCLRFPSGSGVSSQELGISYYLRPWVSPLSSLDSSFPVYKMMIIKFALCTYLAT